MQYADLEIVMPRKVSPAENHSLPSYLSIYPYRPPKNSQKTYKREREREREQIRIPASPSQSRANQQRSRARRREHLADLERAVREYEARDARASVEMQAASRKVAWRCEMLLGLLGTRFGVDRGDVEGWLDGEWEKKTMGRERKQEEEDEVEGGGGGGADTVSTRMAMPTTTAAAAAAAAVTMATAQVPISPSPPSQPGLSQGPLEDRASKQPAPCLRPQGDIIITPTAATAAEMTSCDEAADMIANLQGNGDVSGARRLLGCPSSSKCQVKNTKLFQLMVETP